MQRKKKPVKIKIVSMVGRHAECTSLRMDRQSASISRLDPLDLGKKIIVNLQLYHQLVLLIDGFSEMKDEQQRSTPTARRSS
jgi:hypothetical protein